MQPYILRNAITVGQWRIALVAICLGLTWLSFGQASQAANEQQAGQNVGQAARLYIGKSSVATVEMQITKPDFQRTISIQFWWLGESKILVSVLQPP